MDAATSKVIDDAKDAPVGEESTADKKSSVRRTHIACESCRKRRVRCDGTKPACQVCRKSCVACVYDIIADRRKPFTRDVVKAMQMRIDALEDELRQMQVTQSGSAATRPTSNPASRKNDSLPLQGGLALNNNGEVRFFGGSSSYSTVCTDAVEDSGIINPIRARALTHGLGPDSVPCDDPITPPRPPALPTELLTEILSLAFEFCLSQFGLVNERRFYADMAANPRRRTSHYSPVLYYVILAMGCKYLEPSRHEMVSKTCTDPNDFATRGAVYINWARFTLEQEWTQPELSTITALNCLAVYLYGQGLDGPATLYNGIAIRLCEDFGLHLGLHRLKATPAYFRRFGNEDEKARADTFYAALQSNVMFCISVGRNVPFSVDEIDQALPLVDGEAEFDKPEHRSTAFHLASKLVLIVTKMMRSVYTLDVNVSLGEDARRCQSFI